MSETIIGAGLAIGLAGVGAAIGQGILAKQAMIVMGKNPSMHTFFLTVTILGIALVESVVIYGLVVAFNLLDITTIGTYSSIGAGLAIGLAAMGSGIGEGLLISGALKAMGRNPSIKGKIMAFMVLFVALVEVVAIYGLLIAFNITGLGIENAGLIGAGCAIGFAGVGVAIGQGFAAGKSLELMGQNPKMIGFFLTLTILGLALVESVAIYGLIVSFSIIGAIETLSISAGIGAGLAIGVAGLGAGLGEGLLIKGAFSAIVNAPESKGKIMAFMVLFVALVEVVAIYGLIVAFKILG